MDTTDKLKSLGDIPAAMIMLGIYLDNIEALLSGIAATSEQKNISTFAEIGLAHLEEAVETYNALCLSLDAAGHGKQMPCRATQP